MNYHRVDWERYSVLAVARKNPPATRAPVSRVRKRAATPIATKLRRQLQAHLVPHLIPKAQKYKEINDPKLGCVVISLDDDDEPEAQATTAAGMQTGRAGAFAEVKTSVGEMIGTYHLQGCNPQCSSN